MRVLLAPHGTRGDVQPTIALAVALRARGHEVSFVAPANFGAWIRSHGFRAESDGVDIERILRGGQVDLRSIGWLRGYLTGMCAQLFAAMAPASEGCDLIVGAGVQPAASAVAEWREVPYVNVAFCPCVIPGGDTPPPTVRTQTLPRWLNRLLWQIGLPIGDLILRGAVNDGRARLGLVPITNPLQDLIGQHLIVAADRDLAPFPEDAPARAMATDAWMLDEPAELDPRLDAFLTLDPPPVYVGFGSMVAKRVPDLAAHVIDAVRALGRRAIVAGGWADLDKHVTHASGADDLFVVGEVPHRLVLPRVAAAIHHGGAGTTTAVARAGVPQVLLPHILDQYYWANRIEQLGLGPRAVPVELVTADLLADRLDAALSDPRPRERASALAPAIAARDGTGAAVDYLERLTAGQP